MEVMTLHISIAGRLGSGKSTICRLLEARHGFQVYSTGAIHREIALSHEVSTLEMNQKMANDISFDHAIDAATKKLSMEKAKEPIIFDSRMAWNFAVNSFKVFVTIDPHVAAMRVIEGRRAAEEVYANVEEAKAKLIERGRLENERFKDIYGVDNLDYSNYNLVIDSTHATPEELADLIYAKYQAYCKADGKTHEILLSPMSLYPTETLTQVDPISTSAPIPMVDFEGYHYIKSAHSAVLSAILNRALFVDATRVDMEVQTLLAKLHAVGVSGLHGFEKLGAFRYKSYPGHYLG